MPIIECYNYAAQYLESIGHQDEWMLVDKQEYAFKQIVAGIRMADNPALVTQTVKSVLDTTDELEKEKKKKKLHF